LNCVRRGEVSGRREARLQRKTTGAGGENRARNRPSPARPTTLRQ
jgi:hypothetical protein